MNATSIAYDAAPCGYTVFVLDASGQIVDEYRAGNHSFDSIQDAGASPCVPVNQLLDWAQKTALDTAMSYGIPRRQVFRDTDIMAEEREAV